MSAFAAVVLAAGFGTRLRPLTDLVPKALCPVNNVPLVDLAVGRLKAAPIPSVAVNVHHHRDRMVAHLDRLDVHVSVEEAEPLGTAGAIGNLRPWIDGRPVVVHNGDAWFDGDLSEFVSGWSGDRIRLLVVPTRPGIEPDFDRFTFAGVSAMPWSEVVRLTAEPSGLWEASWLQALAEGRIEPVVHEREWFDTGTPRDYLAANLAASGGRSVIAQDAVVASSARVVESVVWSGAVVADGEHLVRQIRAPGPLTVDAG